MQSIVFLAMGAVCFVLALFSAVERTKLEGISGTYQMWELRLGRYSVWGTTSPTVFVGIAKIDGRNHDTILEIYGPRPV